MESSARVMAVINGSLGSVSVVSSIRPKRMSVLVSRMPSAMSERCDDHVVDVVSERNGIDGGESLPSAAQLVERDGGSRESGEFGDRLAGIGDGQRFSALGALDHLSTLVA